LHIAASQKHCRWEAQADLDHQKGQLQFLSFDRDRLPEINTSGWVTNSLVNAGRWDGRHIKDVEARPQVKYFAHPPLQLSGKISNLLA
jgi:hypothetical protein